MKNRLNLPDGAPVLHMDDPDFAEKLSNTIGLEPGEKLEIHTPQFTREQNAPPVHSPPSPFEQIFNSTIAELKQLGCREWDGIDREGFVLMLLPGEWYNAIPPGTKLTCIFGGDEIFQPGVTDDDIRFGCLAYGVKVQP